MARIGHNDAERGRADSVREPERASRSSDSPEMGRDGSEQGSGAIRRAQSESGEGGNAPNPISRGDAAAEKAAVEGAARGANPADRVRVDAGGAFDSAQGVTSTCAEQSLLLSEMPCAERKKETEKGADRVRDDAGGAFDSARGATSTCAEQSLLLSEMPCAEQNKETGKGADRVRDDAIKAYDAGSDATPTSTEQDIVQRRPRGRVQTEASEATPAYPERGLRAGNGHAQPHKEAVQGAIPTDRETGGTVREYGPSQRAGCTSKNDTEPLDESPTGADVSGSYREDDLPDDTVLRADRRQIEHEGIVERVEVDRVYVKITSRSACGSCRARQACGLAEAQEKIVEVRTTGASEFAPGETVTVGIRRRAGGVAVLLAYVGGLAVLLAVLFCGIGLWGWAEGSAAAAALGGLAVYYVVLWACRRKIEHTIKFTITKI